MYKITIKVFDICFKYRYITSRVNSSYMNKHQSLLSCIFVTHFISGGFLYQISHLQLCPIRVKT